MEEIISKLYKKEYDKLTIGEVFILGVTGENIDGYLKYAKEHKEVKRDNKTKKLSLTINK